MRKEASDRWILVILIACVVLFTATGIAWSQGGLSLMVACMFWLTSFVVALVVIADGERKH